MNSRTVALIAAFAVLIGLVASRSFAQTFRSFDQPNVASVTTQNGTIVEEIRVGGSCVVVVTSKGLTAVAVAPCGSR